MQTIREIRLLAGYSMAEMAECLGLRKATYQGYEEGRRGCPAGLDEQMRRILENDRQFMADLPARVDARLAEEFPDGISSEV